MSLLESFQLGLSTWWSPVALIFFSYVFVKMVAPNTVRQAPLPPGPSPLPLIGNALDFPTSSFGSKFHDMARAYGSDLVHFNLFGRHFVVLDTYAAANDLLEKRSANNSDRPQSTMAQLTGYADWVFVLMQYGQRWRTHRRAAHQAFHPDVVSNAEHERDLAQATRELLRNLLETPVNFSEHIRRAFAASVLRTVYGFDLGEGRDKYFNMGETITKIGIEMSTPGKFLVDILPILRFLPSWLPGTGFKRKATSWKAHSADYRDALFALGMEVRANGAGEGSLISKVLEASQSGGAEDLEHDIMDMCKGVAATMYAGATDTTNSVIHAFFLIMSLYPDVQRCAQAELDSVVGLDRLPTFADRPSLPYMNALVKEVMRWNVISRIGVGHVSTADDVYNGFFIPAGSTLIPNAWAMSRDERAYTDPEKFDPDRFLKDGQLNPDMRDPWSYVFGFGRRICPGLRFADAAIFIIFASVLHVFQIGPLVGEYENGRPFETRVDGGLTARPKPFQCAIQPRSDHLAEVVRLASGV